MGLYISGVYKVSVKPQNSDWVSFVADSRVAIRFFKAQKTVENISTYETSANNSVNISKFNKNVI